MRKREHISLLQSFDEDAREWHWDDQSDEREPIERINALGQKGWQLAAVEVPAPDIRILYLKRLISE